jgi:hypothetical protein
VRRVRGRWRRRPFQRSPGGTTVRDRRWHTKQCRSAGDGGGRAALTAPPPTRLMENAPSLSLASASMRWCNVRRTPSLSSAPTTRKLINIYISTVLYPSRKVCISHLARCEWHIMITCWIYVRQRIRKRNGPLAALGYLSLAYAETALVSSI